MGERDKVPQWLRNFIFGTYLTESCACECRRPCQSFFCVLCSQDHLCHKQFETPGGLHFGHDKIQVRKGSRRYAVTESNLKAYMDTKLVQKFIINEEETCFLKAKERSGPGSSASTKDGQLRACRICGGSLQSSATSGAFCSLECLMLGASPGASHEDNEKGIPPSSAIKPEVLQKGPTRKVAPKESTPTQDDKLLVEQTPPGALKRKLSEGAGSSCRRLKSAPSPEATVPTATPEATEGGPSTGEGAKSPTTSGREQRQISVSASNLVQGETSAERSLNVDQEWLLNATTATLEATVANSNCSKEEADMLVDDKNVDLLLHFFQHSFM